MGAPDRLFARAGSPLAWHAVDKCLLAAAICGGTALLFALTANFAGGWPYLSSEMSAAAGRAIAGGAWYGVVVWAAIAALLLAVRRRAPDNRLVVHLTVQAYAVSTALFTYFTGPLAAGGWLTFIGGAIVGLLLFDRLVVWLGVLTWVVSLAAIAFFVETGRAPFPPFPVDSLRVGALSLAIVGLILPLCSYIITSWHAREAELEALSRRDPLTGVANRRHLLAEAERELSRARRYGEPLSCVMIDLDHFKRVNDEHGHAVGDRVLVATARAIEETLRDVDVMGRYGGEEFVVLLPNTDAAAATEVAERCRHRIGELDVDGVSVTASLGVAELPRGAANDVEELLRLADEEMYRAKGTGRNRVETHDDS